ncbi:MAG: helix-turn-helix domain-containing protein [Planctomycetota bacterium]
MIPYGKIASVKQLGALIRSQRKKAGVLQADAADLTGVGTRFLSELERGKESAEVGKVLSVIHRLGLEVWVLPRGGGGRPNG